MKKFIDFFIDRPVTATIINLMLIVSGALSFRGLTVDEYPRIVVPKIKVETPYSNASAQTVEREITAPIEEAMSLVEGVDSISSASRAGFSEVRLRFSPKVSMTNAVMQVTEQLARIMQILPEDADTPLIKRSDEGGSGFMYLGIKSKFLQGAALTHFAKTHIKSHFQGIDGVAEVEIIGAPYAMNIVLDALALNNQRVGPEEIIGVLKKNELLLQAGRKHTLEPISLDVAAKDAEDYRRLVVGKNEQTPVFLGDVATVDLINDDTTQKIRLDGQNAIFLAISKTPDGNNLKVANAVYAMVDKVNQEIRGRAQISVDSDHSIFVRASLQSIFRTILESAGLVILIIFLFLRHLRATLVPLVTIPISLIATFISLKIFGLSINTVSLLAMVLAVGLVVDDAIVVLENIFRFREEGYSASEAARKGAKEIGFAIIAMTITLMSVFLPLAFVSDITGVILREFAITLASSVLFSGIVALTLSPLMCASVLKRPTKDGKIAQKIEQVIRRTEAQYIRLLTWFFYRPRFLFLALLLIFLAGGFLYFRLDSNLLPKEDRGIIGAHIPMVPGFNLDDMEPYVAQVEQVFLDRPETEHLAVFGFEDGVQVVSVLKPWAKRSVHAEKIVAAIRNEIKEIPTINIYPWSWDVGLDALKDDSNDRADIRLALKTAGSYEDLEKIAQNLVGVMRRDGVLLEPRSDLDMNEKAYLIKILREPQVALGIDEKTVSIALQTYAHRIKASEFKLEGQRYKVFLEPHVKTEDLNSIYVNTAFGEQVPLSTVAKIKEEVQAPVLRHLNQMRTANVLPSLKAGQGLDEAKAYLEKLISEHVPKNVSISLEGTLAMQKKSTATFFLLFFAGLVFIFAIMAIQFEGLLDPLVILFTVPFACIGGVLILWMTQSGTNLYTQVGMLTLVGLITKHGILLTEFVIQKQRDGLELVEAVFLSAKLRFRPIIMTTFATVLGALPLVVSPGAGREARAAIGLVIVGGMIFGTILTLFVLPSSIYGAHSLRDRLMKKQKVAL